MNEIIKRNESSELSADFADALVSGVSNAMATMPMVGGGKPLLKMSKTGQWVFGVASDPVQVGSDWCINPRSMQHGWICWDNSPEATKSTLLGDLKVSVLEALPPEPAPIKGVAWQPQRSFDLICVSGEDEGVEVTFASNSLGGLQAVNNLFVELRKHYAKKPVVYSAPIVQLDVTDYPHPRYGKIFKPIFDIVDWATMDGSRQSESGNEAPPAAPQAAPQAAPAAQAAAAKPPLTGGAPRRQRPVGRA